jgi:hypothetical protein
MTLTTVYFLVKLNILVNKKNIKLMKDNKSNITSYGIYNLSVLDDKYFAKYKDLFIHSLDKYNLINKYLLFNYLFEYCDDKYYYDFNQNTFSNIIYRDVDKRYNLYIKYIGFDFKYLIINSILDKHKLLQSNSNILIISNISTILYNYNTYYNEHKLKYNLDACLIYNSEFKQFELENKLNKQYPLLSAFNNILSSHKLNDYIKFLENLKESNTTYKNYLSKYDLISCHIGYSYGINQTASFNFLYKIPHFISSIAISLKVLKKDGILVLFMSIINLEVPSIKKLFSLLLIIF